VLCLASCRDTHVKHGLVIRKPIRQAGNAAGVDSFSIVPCIEFIFAMARPVAKVSFRQDCVLETSLLSFLTPQHLVENPPKIGLDGIEFTL
jgi:hypothetical protein